MNFDINQCTILLVRHGSHAYGLNTPESDLDIKGICVPPKSILLGCAHKFEQHVASEPNDRVVYALNKFMKLASDCNPNIIEILFGVTSDILMSKAPVESLLDNRNLFITKRARHTFSGYAYSQLKRIKTHRSWLLNPPKEPPQRKTLGLSEEQKITATEMGAFETMDQSLLTKEAYRLFMAERAYRTQLQHWHQYLEWKKSRNPKRAELEAKHGYDTKHAMHLIRLMRRLERVAVDYEGAVQRVEQLAASLKGLDGVKQLTESTNSK